MIGILACVAIFVLWAVGWRPVALVLGVIVYATVMFSL